MGSLENGVSLKRDPLLRSSSTGKADRHSLFQRPRSRFSRFLLFQKLDYVQWICTVAVFLFFVILFQLFLPGSVLDNTDVSLKKMGKSLGDLTLLKELGILEFGEDITFEPSKILRKFQKEAMDSNSSSERTSHRFGYRKPQLALVFADLLFDSLQVQMVTLVDALREIGYAVEVYSLKDGPLHSVWQKKGIRVTLIQACDETETEIVVDWLNYDGILLNSIEVKDIFSCFLQEPFRSIPLIWTIQEGTLATRSNQYRLYGQFDLLNDWKRAFNRSNAIVFPNYVLPMMYSMFDAGNFFVIPGTPQIMEAEVITSVDKENPRIKMGYDSEDFVLVIVGSQFLYRGMWLEHAIILQALLPIFPNFPSDKYLDSRLKIIVLGGYSTSNYSVAVEAIAVKLKYPKKVVKHVAVEDIDDALNVADLVIYGSFLEEQSFPETLIKSMSLEKPIIAPDLSIIKRYVDDRVNGYLFPKKNIKVLTKIILEIISEGKLSSLARNVASIGRATAKNLMVSDAIDGYISLLGGILKLPSEIAPVKTIMDVSPDVKEKWQWNLFEGVITLTNKNKTFRSFVYLDKFEKKWNHTKKESSSTVNYTNDSFVYSIWEDEKNIRTTSTRKKREEEQMRDRSDQPHGTWEDVYRNAKKADRLKTDFRERDDGELERTGQPLCIYEPYFGEGVWPFLHRTSLYRGIGLASKGRRPGADDIDASSRLQLLNNPYYRDVLGEYGAFFAIANRVDRIHKNAWIGFQSWRATANKVSLSKIAEKALLDAIQSRRHGDALYFWAGMNMDPRNPSKLDFWSFCDSINAGNCKIAFSTSLRMMYGLKHNLDDLPPMPVDGHTWSVMQSWALPTRSFLEFVMFSRMFVDALDAQMYDEHHGTGTCSLSMFKDKHCYSRLLELLINVWAYHSARRMVYIEPGSGKMQEHHVLDGRRGKMWVKWFSFGTLKSMDEDLAEEADSETPAKRWIWPLTGEVIWKGVYEREKNMRHQVKESRKQKSKEKMERMKHRRNQKVIGKYIKPPPEMEDSNSTSLAETESNLDSD